ncbi:protein outspread [Musca vetustissima]|uniref:protein outspread n=1 Tax=Musca vetustissima TaxID=27455 RepID=UPI002AB69B5F|nr:protein outspread [Musca vetustissima]
MHVNERKDRWQRRWFVLYDDGELTYSVDEHPETVPQACIDMTKVLEVTTAEDVTGHSNSIAITAPDRVTFVKGTCPEESKWWLNILVAFPKAKGRHKRNATFPGAQATTTINTTGSLLQSSNSDAANTAAAAVARSRHNSYHKDILTSTQSTGASTTTTTTAMLTDEKKKSSSSTTNGNTKLWSHNDVKVGTTTTTTSGMMVRKSPSNSSKITKNSRANIKNNHRCNNNMAGGGGNVVATVGHNDDEDEDEVVAHDDDEDDDVDDDDDEDDGVETGEDDEDDDDDLDEEESGHSTGEECNTKKKSSTLGGGSNSSSNNNNSNNVHDENNRNAVNEIKNRVSPPCLLIEDIRRDEKTIKDLANTITNLSQQQKNRWTTTAVNNVLNSHLHQSNNNNNNNNNKLDDKNSRDEPDFYRPTTISSNNNKSSTSSCGGGSGDSANHLRPKSLPLAANSTPAIVSAIVKKIPTVLATAGAATTAATTTTTANNKSSLRYHQHHLQQQQHQQHSYQSRKQQKQALERGDPDGGCNLDDLSSNYLSKTVELRVNPVPPSSVHGSSSGVTTSTSAANTTPNSTPSSVLQESLNAKKGWLMKQDNRTGDWTKHWFTLSGAALFYYRDPVSEERGVLDGVLDVNSLTNVAEVNAQRNNAFQLTTWDKRRLILASLSPNSRNSWIAILRNAAGLPNNTSDDMKSEIEKDFIKAQRIMPSTTQISPQTPLTPKTALHFSSDEEYRTASEGGRRDSIGDWGSPLSPSPPSTLNMMRAKDRMRSRTTTPCPRMHKRSRSSPPSSRRSTVDSVGSDDLPVIHTVHEEINLNVDKELQFRLSVVEKERDLLRDEAKEREARMSELLNTLERTEQELNHRIQEMEEVRECLTSQLEDAKRNASEIIERLTDELDESQRKIKDLEDRLARGIEENENLYKRLREMESCSPASFINLQRSKMKRMDSLSDLTHINDIDPYGLERDSLAEEYNELKGRFEKAVNEIRAMKRELKESQNQYDSLEISYASLKQDLERKEIEDQSQLQMMADRIQDLTLKYSSSERQVRTLKQKLAKSERRRSLSLKGKEQLTVSKELEIKLNDLETKMDEPTLDSPPSRSSPAVTAASPGNLRLSEHLLERLRCLENVLVSSKDRLEQGLSQLQNLRSSRNRRSVSPITDRKDSYRFVERCLQEVCEATSSNEHIPRTEISIESLQDVCHKCCELRKRADQLLQEVHRKLNDSCQHCLQVREKLHSLKEQHESEILRLQQSHAKDLSALMQQVEHQRSAIRCLEAEKNAINQDLNKSEELMEERERELQSVTQLLHTKEDALHATQGEQRELLKRLEAEEEKVRSYQEESDALTMKCARQDDEYVMLLQERDYLQSELTKEQDRNKRLEKRVELLEMEHGKQMECLQQAYRDQMLTHCPDFSNVIDEESFRQRYQSEIEQLRTLCEKGLSAMESSHRRTINDLEEKHKQEIERLLIEKETALAEETQATLAALDAMRKAHQSEVQREVARFKQEFLKQFQQKGERTLDSTKAKEEELEELRQEILSFSEKYSIKCVENAALEEKLRAANQKLKHYQQMQQLELRNKQFRAHLASDDPTKDMQYVQGLSTAKDGDDEGDYDNGAVCQDSEHVHATRNCNQDDSKEVRKDDAADENDDERDKGHHLKDSREQVHGQSQRQQMWQQNEWLEEDQGRQQQHSTTKIVLPETKPPPSPATTTTYPLPLSPKQEQHHQQLQSIIITGLDSSTPAKTCSSHDQYVFDDGHNEHSSGHDDGVDGDTNKNNNNDVVVVAAVAPPFDTTSITNNTNSIATTTAAIIGSSNSSSNTITTTPSKTKTTTSSSSSLMPASGSSGIYGNNLKSSLNFHTHIGQDTENSSGEGSGGITANAHQQL